MATHTGGVVASPDLRAGTDADQSVGWLFAPKVGQLAVRMRSGKGLPHTANPGLLSPPRPDLDALSTQPTLLLGLFGPDLSAGRGVADPSTATV
ncbi:MAG: hypothetical protein WBD41_13415 [Rhodococcus sp. (in: high G+C Gram-positive bacteria)]